MYKVKFSFLTKYTLRLNILFIDVFLHNIITCPFNIRVKLLPNVLNGFVLKLCKCDFIDRGHNIGEAVLILSCCGGQSNFIMYLSMYKIFTVYQSLLIVKNVFTLHDCT